MDWFHCSGYLNVASIDASESIAPDAATSASSRSAAADADNVASVSIYPTTDSVSTSLPTNLSKRTSADHESDGTDEHESAGTIDAMPKHEYQNIPYT